jgi:glycosyltransferase involved in cell wall biosynthesis
MPLSVTGPAGTLPVSPFLNTLKPWVTVVCTSYNHALYVEAALQSVLEQTYPNVELIVIDNGSTDGTPARIDAFLARHPQRAPAIRYIRNPDNQGLCRAFNSGLRLANGQYMIDLAADDVLLPDRIEQQVAFFRLQPPTCAVVFSNAGFIDGSDRLLGYHYPVDADGRARVPVPSGALFEQVLRSYFICTPTMLIRRDVLEAIGGYDESLSYEDFDFWVRTARVYTYAYQDAVLTHKRRLPDSQSARVMQPGDLQLESTLRVCYKAFDQCQTPAEYQALAGRVRLYVRKSFYAEQFSLALRFGRLLTHLEQPRPATTILLLLSRLQIPVNGLYRRFLLRRGHRPPAFRLN